MLVDLLIANAILLLGAGACQLFWRNNRRFRLNRSMLLLTMGSALAVLVLKLPVPQWGQALPGAVSVLLDEVVVNPGEAGTGAGLDWESVAWIIWGTGAGLLLLRLGYQWLQVVRMLRRYPHERKAGYTLVRAEGSGLAASFFRYMILDSGLAATPAALEVMEAHERCHIRQGHSWDRLLGEFVRILFWYNPAAHLLVNQISEQHEFLADEAAQKVKPASEYRRILAQVSLRTHCPELAHPFNQKLKNRINMLDMKSGNKARFSHMLALVAMLGLFLAGSLDLSAQQLDPDGNEMAAGQASTDKEAAPELDKHPQLLNAPEFYKALKYPAACEADGIEGKVIVRMVVGKKGELVSSEFVQPVDERFTQAVQDALPVLKFSPGEKDGKPVKAVLTMPVAFKLNK